MRNRQEPQNSLYFSHDMRLRCVTLRTKYIVKETSMSLGARLLEPELLDSLTHNLTLRNTGRQFSWGF